MSTEPNATAPTFSFVLPAHNEGMNVRALLLRLDAVARGLGESYEIIVVDDGSTDDTADALELLTAELPALRPLFLSRNFGHMAALTAGMENARATGAVVCLDCDGQHPPELIPVLVEKWRGGADIVQTLRKATADDSGFKRVTSRGFYALLNRMSDLELPAGAADYRLMDRQAVDALNSLPERVRFLRGLVHWIGYRMETVDYEAPARMGGVSKYNARKMLMFALSGITSFSIRPLRLTFVAGLGVLLLSAVYAVYIMVKFLVGSGDLVQGWPSTLLSILVLSGIQLLTLGVASEYLGRIYEETKARPVYLLRKRRGVAAQADREN